MRPARILVITRNLPPLRGGIERLMQHAVAELAARWECDVVGPSGSRAYLPGARAVWELPAGLPWFHLRALRRVLRSSKYDLVVAGNGLVAPLAALAAARNRCPFVVFVHGLDLVAPSAIYQATFVPSIRRAAAVIANSRFTASLAEQRGVPAARVSVIHPGVEMALPGERRAFRDRHRLGDRPILLSVGRLVHRKGIAEFIEQALPLILQRHPDACFVVIGDEPQQAAGDPGNAQESIKAAAKKVPGSAILLLGEVSDPDLAQAYAAANVFVFPVLAIPGDVEGFGMVALEAASHGVPTVAFAVGGVGDAVSGGNGRLIDAGDYRGFASAVVEELADASDGRRKSCRDWAAKNSWRSFGDRVRALVEQVCRTARA